MAETQNRRRYTRFFPDQNTLSWFCQGHEAFSPDYVGLTTDESHGGSGFLFVGEFPFKNGEKVFIKSGELAPLKSEVRWIKTLGERIYHICLMYIE